VSLFDVFISYSTRDKAIADAACAALEQAAVRCWIAPRDVIPGSDWGASIVDAINSCRAMVLIFSSSANDSPQIRNEVVQAVNKGVPIIPVRVEDVLPRKSLAYFVDGLHWLDALTPPLEQHLERLTKTITAMMQVSQRPTGATPDGRVEQRAIVPAAQGTSLSPVSAKAQKNDYAETGQGSDWNEIIRAQRLEWGREGYERDEREAMRIYRGLAERGDKVAQTELATMYAQGRGAQTDHREALNWYRKAAQQGWAPAQYILGGLYANGRGAERDDVEAVAWYRKAADQDYKPGMVALGEMYCTGRGVVKNERDAVAWYRKAAEKGDSVAQFYLGIMYESGRGVERDEDKAQWWIRKSAAQGFSEALKRFPDALKRSPNVE
jgi:TIR domain/Sel1 repeat